MAKRPRSNPFFDNLKVIQQFLNDADGGPYYLHFTNVNKVGLNPKQEKKFSTPVGIYTYPLNEYILSLFKGDRIPYGGRSKYVAVVKATGTKPLAVLGEDHVQIGDTHLGRNAISKYVSEVEVQYKESGNDYGMAFDQWYEGASSDAPGALWFYTTRVAGGLSVPGFVQQDEDSTAIPFFFDMSGSALTRAWSKYLRDMGISGVSDPGFGIIHPNEPAQTFFLRTSDVSVEVFMDNPWLEMDEAPRQKQYMEFARFEARQREEKGETLREIPMRISAFDVTGPLPPANITTSAEWSTLTGLYFRDDLHAKKCTITSCFVRGFWGTSANCDIGRSIVQGTFQKCLVEDSVVTLLRRAENSDFVNCAILPPRKEGVSEIVSEIDGGAFRGCTFRSVLLDVQSGVFESCSFVDCEFVTQLLTPAQFKNCVYDSCKFADVAGDIPEGLEGSEGAMKHSEAVDTYLAPLLPPIQNVGDE